MACSAVGLVLAAVVAAHPAAAAGGQNVGRLLIDPLTGSAYAMLDEKAHQECAKCGPVARVTRPSPWWAEVQPTQGGVAVGGGVVAGSALLVHRLIEELRARSTTLGAFLQPATETVEAEAQADEIAKDPGITGSGRTVAAALVATVSAAGLLSAAAARRRARMRKSSSGMGHQLVAGASDLVMQLPDEIDSCAKDEQVSLEELKSRGFVKRVSQEIELRSKSTDEQARAINGFGCSTKQLSESGGAVSLATDGGTKGVGAVPFEAVPLDCAVEQNHTEFHRMSTDKLQDDTVGQAHAVGENHTEFLRMSTENSPAALSGKEAEDEVVPTLSVDFYRIGTEVPVDPTVALLPRQLQKEYAAQEQ